MSPGETVPLERVSAVLGGEAVVESASVRVHPRAFVVHGRGEDAHFCVRRTLSLPSRRVHVDAHLDLHLRVKHLPGERMDVFLPAEAGALVYVGTCGLGMSMQGTHETKLQYRFRDVPAALDRRLCPGAEQPVDGAALAAALASSSVDRLALAERLAASWLGPLPVAMPAGFEGAPEDVRRWAALWARLDTFHDHPWTCWPARYARDEERGVDWFQSEWQNGSTFGAKDGAVLIDAWWTQQRYVEHRCASDVGSFALQFVIYGLTEGAVGTYTKGDVGVADALGVRTLDLPPWPIWLGENDGLTWLGGDGYLGRMGDHGIVLRTTK